MGGIGWYRKEFRQEFRRPAGTHVEVRFDGVYQNADFWLNGVRWRAAVCDFSPVEMLVERPTPPGTEQVALWWGYYDELVNWTWDVEPEHPMKVRVYTPGDHVRLLLNGTETAARTVTRTDRAAVTFTAPYRG